MKFLVLVYLLLYLLVTLLAALYSFIRTKKMSRLRFLLVCGILLVLGVTAIFYMQGYHVLQMLFFALGFNGISTLFLYNGRQEGSNFVIGMLFHVGRFLFHIQFILLLYLFR